MLNVDRVASEALRTVFSLGLGAIVEIWPDGSFTERTERDAPIAGRLPLLSLPRTVQLPTYGEVKAWLRAAAIAEGLEFESDD
jgi:hypothetical protein